MTFSATPLFTEWRAAHEARTGGRAVLAQALTAARERTLALFAAYEAALRPVCLAVPCTAELNPPLWELGHVGWFQAWWLARNPQRGLGAACDPDAARAPSRLAGADALYNSSLVPHDTRWQLPLPGAEATRAELREGLGDTLALLAASAEDDAALYFFRLALFHEDMHAEAAVYMAQALEIALPAGVAFPSRCADAPRVAGASAPVGSAGTGFDAGREGAPLRLPARSWTLGSASGGFAFDNELGTHAVALAAFEIDATPVTWARYLPFVESGGYGDARWWSPEGWQWLQGPGRGMRAPRYLRREEGGGWSAARFGAWQPLDAQAPAVHLSGFEADAWCRWAGRRLPTEAEWECAAMTQPQFQWGDVWDWTASPFEPYPGFAPHPYRDYSAPWFCTRRVLRGASAATSPRMRHPKYRNFFTPERNDIHAGFRSCALP